MRRLMLLFLLYLALAVLSSSATAQYLVSNQVVPIGDARRFTWSTQLQPNNPKNWPGLVAICYLYSSNVHLRSYIPVENPISAPANTCWSTQTTTSAISINGQRILPAPPVGLNWFAITASRPEAIYPNGQTVSWSMTVDQTIYSVPVLCAQVSWLDNQYQVGYTTIAGPGYTSVPEPSTYVTILISICTFRSLRRRH